MEQRSSSLEDILIHRAMEQSHLHYGGQGPDKNPLEILMDRELAEAGEQRELDRAETLYRMLTYIADGVNLAGTVCHWKRITRKLLDGHTATYIKPNPDEGIYLPCVEIIDRAGRVFHRHEHSRLIAQIQPRSERGEKSIRLEIEVLTVESETAAIRVGTRILGMAREAGVTLIQDLGGQGLAKKLKVTRQAVSLTNKWADEKVRTDTGGKSGARGLRHKPNPNKGKSREEIQGPQALSK